MAHDEAYFEEVEIDILDLLTRLHASVDPSDQKDIIMLVESMEYDTAIEALANALAQSGKALPSWAYEELIELAERLEMEKSLLQIQELLEDLVEE